MKIISDSFYYNGLKELEQAPDSWTKALREMVARAQLLNRLEAMYGLNHYQRILLHRLSETGECVAHSLEDFRVVTNVLRKEGYSYELLKLEHQLALSFQNI